MRRHRWLYKMILSYLPLFLIVISLLLFIFVLMVNQIVQKEKERTNENYTHHILQTFDNQIKALHQNFLRDVYFHETVQHFFNPLYQDDSEINYLLSRELQRFVHAYDLIDSIYAYRESDRMVLSDSIMLPADHFGDALFISQQIASQSEQLWSNARLYSEMNRFSGRQVISAVNAYPLGKEPRGFIVLNLSVHRLQDFYENVGEVDFSRVSIRDASGTWLAGDMDQQSSAEPDLLLQSSIWGWTVASTMNPQQMLGSFELISEIWIVCVALIIIFGLWWLIFAIRKNYEPIESLAARLEGFSLKKSLQLKGSYDEFRFIESALNGLLEESQSYSRKLDETEAIRENALFQEMIGGIRLADVDIDGILAMKNVDRSRPMCLMQVEIDRYTEFERKYSRSDQNLLKFALKSVIREMAEKHGVTVWPEWIGERRVGVLLQKGSGTNTDERLMAYVQELLKWVEAHLSFTVTLSEGEWVNHVSELYVSYETSTELLHLKASLGRNRLITKSDTDDSGELGYYQLIPEVHRLTDSFKLGKESWRNHLAMLLSKIRMNAMPRKEIENLFEYFFYKFSSELGDTAGSEAKEYWNQLLVEQLKETISNFDTVEELFSQLNKLLSTIFSRMLKWREANGRYALVDKAKAYILEHYRNPELSLNQISDVFEMNPTQFSQWFKQSVGEKFVDYVTRIRIEQAKRRLSDTDDPIQAIGFEVGYTHAVSFNRAFKKLVGQTPSEFRKAAAEGNGDEREDIPKDHTYYWKDG